MKKKPKPNRERGIPRHSLPPFIILEQLSPEKLASLNREAANFYRVVFRSSSNTEDMLINWRAFLLTGKYDIELSGFKIYIDKRVFLVHGVDVKAFFEELRIFYIETHNSLLSQGGFYEL